MYSVLRLSSVFFLSLPSPLLLPCPPWGGGSGTGYGEGEKTSKKGKVDQINRFGQERNLFFWGGSGDLEKFLPPMP